MKHKLNKILSVLLIMSVFFSFTSTAVFAESLSKDIKIYYLNGDWTFTPVAISTPSGEDPYVYALNVMVQGKNLPADCLNEFPVGTKINSVKISGGIAYVDINKLMNEKLIEKKWITDVSRDILTHNVLSFDPSITEVRFTFDGQSLDSYKNVKRSDYYKKNSESPDVSKIVNEKMQKLNEKFKNMTSDEIASYIKNAQAQQKEDSDVSAMYTAKVCVDPGHGGSASGAVGMLNGVEILEKNINLGIALALRDELVRSNFSVIMTRTTDTYVENTARASLANNNGCDVFISVHCNASPNTSAKGTTGIYPNNHDITLSKTLMGLIHQQVLQNTSLVENQAPYQDYEPLIVLRTTTMPAVLTETGFMSNTSDLTYLNSSINRTAIGKAISYGVVAWYL